MTEAGGTFGTEPRSVPQLITRWDLDKTYLRSEFDRLGDLARSLFERPDQKRAVPGAASLLRLLGQGPVRVHVLSGSPRQLRGAILKRFAMDGVRVDELTLKPNASNLLRLRMRALKDQLGYKLSALLAARAAELRLIGSPVPEVLFGDDSEGDAFVYSLYADVCGGAIDLRLLEDVLAAGHTYRDVAERTLELARTITQHGPGGSVRILVHLERQSLPSRFAAFGPRLVPFHNYVQASLLLLEWGYLSAAAALSLCHEMLALHRFDLDAMARSYVDLRRRGHVTERVIEALAAVTVDAAPELQSLPERMREAVELPSAVRPPSGVVPPLDYLALAREHRSGRGRHRRPE